MTVNHVPEAPQSASGDYAWLGAEPGSVADQLYMSAADEWNQAINSRFVNEMLDDTLPESILKSYLIQDFKFFNQGIMAHAIELAPRQETKDNSEQTPANREYCEYLTKLVQGTWEELITALCCMEWIYLAWAKRTIDAGVIQQIPAHKGWVDLHEGDHFRAWTGRLIALVNEYASVDGSEAEVFRTIVHLERRFFDDSYPQE